MYRYTHITTRYTCRTAQCTRRTRQNTEQHSAHAELHRTTQNYAELRRTTQNYAELHSTVHTQNVTGLRRTYTVRTQNLHSTHAERHVQNYTRQSTHAELHTQNYAQRITRAHVRRITHTHVIAVNMLQTFQGNLPAFSPPSPPPIAHCDPFLCLCSSLLRTHSTPQSCPAHTNAQCTFRTTSSWRKTGKRCSPFIS